ncbi:MAG: hypothetical protein H0V27_10400 [Pyrinomonadaceae bacterium]|nr:hypothetical protein [Pyrinomonadaceae bacterium]
MNVRGEVKAKTQGGSGRVTLQPRPSSLPMVDAVAAEVKESLGDAWLPEIYRTHIRPLRTRAYALHPMRKDAVDIQHTLLGIELKTGRYRTLCPDLATARYLAVWTRAGCSSIAVPYDITKISRLADELESAWHRMLFLIDHSAAERKPAFRFRVRGNLLTELQYEISQAGAGATIPQFNQNTKQRG